jgi:hypothetical protein
MPCLSEDSGSNQGLEPVNMRIELKSDGYLKVGLGMWNVRSGKNIIYIIIIYNKAIIKNILI